MEEIVDLLSGRSIVLASGSPRRRQLLEQIGLQFDVIIPDESVEAGVCSGRSPENYVLEASLQKAAAVAASLDHELVIAADTVAVCNGQMIGKPQNREHAHRILSTLNGKRHFVLTGVTVWDCDTNKHVARVESSRLQMLQLSDQQLQRYLDTDQWIGKAGAFGYQDGLDWVVINKGYVSTVVGLPIEVLPDMIRDLFRQPK